jgi:hypothetical protein
MNTLSNTIDNMSSTINHNVVPQMQPAMAQRSAPAFVAEWQERGLETLSGLTLRKVRLVLAQTPLPSMTTAPAAA